MPSLVMATEWEDVPRDQQRLESSIQPVTEKKQEVDATEKVVSELSGSVHIVRNSDSLYNVGEGVIDGAFGVLFDLVLPDSITKISLGWQPIKKLPGTVTFQDRQRVLDLEAFNVSPPAVPKLLNKKQVVYTVYVDFEHKPLWIKATNVPNIDAVINVLTRKYGNPILIDKTTLRFSDGHRHLQISRTKNKGTLDYYALDKFETYLARRNVTLKFKYKEAERVNLSATEIKILTIADQLFELRRSGKESLGVAFGKRVGFHIKPDVYQIFQPSKPLLGLLGGDYKIMVSPDLRAVITRYERKGPKAELITLKYVFDQALRLVYGGFLKNTENHSVISFRGLSISVLIRQGTFSYSVLDSDENKKYNTRLKTIKIAKRKQEQAKQQKLAEIQKQKALEAERIRQEQALAIARAIREKEIAEETGF